MKIIFNDGWELHYKSCVTDPVFVQGFMRPTMTVKCPYFDDPSLNDFIDYLMDSNNTSTITLVNEELGVSNVYKNFTQVGDVGYSTETPIAMDKPEKVITFELGQKLDFEMQIDEANKINEESRTLSELTFVSLAQNELVDDAAILENGDLFLVWDKNFTGKRGAIVKHKESFYRSNHDIIDVAQNEEPSKSSTIWAQIGNPTDEWPEWFQPLGAHDAYGMGDQVTHKGMKWISQYAVNTWEPSVFGWQPYEPAS